MSKEFDIDCLLKSIDYNLTDIARAEFHKWLRAKDKQIADLESKLTENEKESNVRYESWQEEIRECDRLRAVLAEVRKQLAEKEKEVEIYKQAEKKAIHFYSDEFVEKDKELKELRWKVKQADQDKISFAVEQLTEIREYVKECQSLDTTEGKVRLDIAKKIRLKIEELKKENKNV